MTDIPPNPIPPQDDLASEFRELGKNLQEAFHTAWESEQRKKLQNDIQTGLNDVAAALKQAANDLSQSQVGQTIKADVQDINQRIKSGEVEEKIRTELLTALQSVNTEIKKAIAKHPTPPAPPPSDSTPPAA